MDLFVIPRRMARLQYMTARLPFTIFDKYVVARYWDEGALPRQGFEFFLGSMDEIARWLLADGRISRRDDAVIRRPESAAKASEPETKAQARWAQYEENLQAATRRAREQAREGIKIAAEAEEAPQAAQMRISAEQDRASAVASQQRPDAADTRRLVKYRPEEAGRPG